MTTTDLRGTPLTEVVPINNAGAAIQLTAPNSTDPTYDGTPLAALMINPPPSGWTRNFLACLSLVANGATTDKGRGIIVQNIGASDGIYIQQDGAGATGLAILNQTDAPNATAAVIGVTLSNQVGLVLRQETSILPSAAGVPLQVQASGSVTEMAQFGSTIASQNGIVFRMFGAGSTVLAVKNNSGTSLGIIDSLGQSSWAKMGAGLGAVSPTYVLQTAVADANPAIVFSGTTKGIRIGFNSVTSIIEGVDTTANISYQPLSIGGSQVLLQIAGITQFQVTGANSIVLGNGAIATNATDGFLYVATCAGQPTGVPSTATGRVPLVYDTTNHQFWIYDGGWKQPKTPAAAAIVTWQ